MYICSCILTYGVCKYVHKEYLYKHLAYIHSTCIYICIYIDIGRERYTSTCVCIRIHVCLRSHI